MITGRLRRRDVPSLPPDAKLLDLGYASGELICDSEIDGQPVRWRFRADGTLLAFIAYSPDYKTNPGIPWMGLYTRRSPWPPASPA